MSEAEVVDAIVEPDTGQELAPVAPPTSLFRTDDPVQVLERAKGVADALAPVIRKAGLVATISGKDYLTVEAWQTLGQQVGVTPVVTSTRRLSNPDGWEATCEARTLDGRVIGAAESMCLRTEERWAQSEDFEIRSMAQTRAMSRALASVLRFIPTLAGFSGTPAEEMQGRSGSRSHGANVPSAKQLDLLCRLVEKQKVKFVLVDTEDGVEESSVVLDKDGQPPATGTVELIRSWASQHMTGGKDGSCSKTIDVFIKGSDDDKSEAMNWLYTKADWMQAQETDAPPDLDGLPSEPPEAGGEIG